MARQLYHPYGTVRHAEGTLPTDYTFTGQRNEAGLGLMHYGARFYSPRLGRFVSADTIVPEPGEPQALNRYSYVYNNPVIYTDPSGHCIPGVDCPGDLPEPDWRPSTDPCSMSQEEYIEYLLWGGVYFEREEAETGGTVGLSLSRDNLNFELGAALAKYAAQGGEASWQAAMGGDPFIVYAVAQFGSQLGEDAYLALGQAYQSRAVQQPADLGVVYQRTDLLTGEEYVGKSKHWQRYLERQREHARDHPNTVFDFQVLERAKAGLDLDVAEESWIRRLGGPERYGGSLANKRWQMSPSRYNAAGGIQPRPY